MLLLVAFYDRRCHTVVIFLLRATPYDIILSKCHAGSISIWNLILYHYIHVTNITTHHASTDEPKFNFGETPAYLNYDERFVFLLLAKFILRYINFNEKCIILWGGKLKIDKYRIIYSCEIRSVTGKQKLLIYNTCSKDLYQMNPKRRCHLPFSKKVTSLCILCYNIYLKFCCFVVYLHTGRIFTDFS